MNSISLIGIDLAKNVFQLHGVDKQRKTIIKKKINRANLMDVIRNINPCKIAMEACTGSNYWGRIFRNMGHEVLLISPQHVKPFVRGNKNDANDAQAIVTAAMQDECHRSLLNHLSNKISN